MSTLQRAPSTETSRFACTTPNQRRFAIFMRLAIVAFVVALLTGAPRWVLVAIAVPIPLLVADLFFVGLHVALGADGITFSRLGRERFVPYAAILSVERWAHARETVAHDEDSPTTRMIYTSVRFTLRDGTVVVVGTGSDEVTFDRDQEPGFWAVGESFGAKDALGAALVRSVRERLTRVAEHARERSSLETRLVRANRSVAEWRRDLALLTEESRFASFRVAAFDPELFWTVLENPAADASARVAAAVVLRARAESGANERVRVVIEGCASPRLRLALEETVAEDGYDETKVLTRLD